MENKLNTELKKYITGLVNIYLDLDLNRVVNPIIEKLVSYGANANLTVTRDGQKIPLIAVIIKDNNSQRAMNTTRFLIDHGLDLTGIEKVGNLDTTPLLWVINNFPINLDFIELLLTNGADSTINTEVDDSSALSRAILQKNYPLIDLLLEYKADPNIPSVIDTIPSIEEPTVFYDLIHAGLVITPEIYRTYSVDLIKLLRKSVNHLEESLIFISESARGYKTALRPFIVELNQLNSVLASHRYIPYRYYIRMYDDYKRINRQSTGTTSYIFDENMLSAVRKSSSSSSSRK